MEAITNAKRTRQRPLLSGDERVVVIDVNTKDGQCVRRYAIRDVCLDYWRGKSGLDEYDAWTRDTKRRAVFHCRAAAERELASIQRIREGGRPCKQ